MPLTQDQIDFYKAFRHDLHRNPGLAYDEKYAHDKITRRLIQLGIDFESGWAVNSMLSSSRPGHGGYGIVATVSGKENTSGRTIGLRADIDALPIKEKTNLNWSSQVPTSMHACGHDGHTATLLAAAEYLSQTKFFNGTAKFIFQPAEEGGMGAKAMIDERLFDRHPMDEVYAIHNWPAMKLGTAGVSYNRIMAASNAFDIAVSGIGAHGAMPHTGVDAGLIASHIHVALQDIISREIDPLKPAVITVGHIHSGQDGGYSIVNSDAILQGTTRAFDDDVQDLLEKRVVEIAQSIAAAHGGSATVDYRRGNIATINDEKCARHAESALKHVFGENNVVQVQPAMTAEDFGWMLRERPGAYLWLGQGEEDPQSPHNQNLHNDKYDFNDGLIEKGAEFFRRIIEDRMALDL